MVVYVRLNQIFIDFCVVCVVANTYCLFFGYNRIKAQKLSFLKSKNIQSLLREQLKIFKHLPDGAIIHRRLIDEDDDFKEEDQELKVLPDDKGSVDIRYLNFTF